MIIHFFLLEFFRLAYSGCVTYARGDYRQFSYQNDPDFQCVNGQQYTATIPFNLVFCATPQIIRKAPGQDRDFGASYQVKIVQITKTEFQFKIQCNTPVRIKVYFFDWVAFVEDQITVYNDFMESITLIDGYRTQIFPFPKNNPDAEITFTIVSYAGGDPEIIIEKQSAGFNLLVTGVDAVQLSGLGVQMIAGLKSIFFLKEQRQLNCTEKADNDINIYTAHPTYVLIFALKKFYDNQQNAACYDDWCAAFFSPCTAQLTIIDILVIDFQYKPHYYKKIRVSHIMSLDHILMLSFKTQKLYFKEKDLTISDLSVASIPIIEFNQESLSLVYYHQCQPNRKIIVTILSLGNNYVYSQYCHNLYNLITMYIYLYQSRTTLTELQFSLTQQGVKIQQKILDNGNTFQLLDIAFQ